MRGKTNTTKRKTQAFPWLLLSRETLAAPAHLSKQTHIGRLHSATPEHCLLQSSERFLKVSFSAQITLIYYQLPLYLSSCRSREGRATSQWSSKNDEPLRVCSETRLGWPAAHPQLLRMACTAKQRPVSKRCYYGLDIKCTCRLMCLDSTWWCFRGEGNMESSGVEPSWRKLVAVYSPTLIPALCFLLDLPT